MSTQDYWATLEEGENLYDDGDFEAALDRFTQAVSLSPASADAYNSRGNALMMLGRHEDALASFEEALKLDSGFVKAALNRAELLVDYLGRAREGEEICDRLLKRPLDLFDAADAYFVKTKAALNAGDLPRAFSMVKKALGLSMDRPEFVTLCGSILFEQGNYRKALIEFDKALSLVSDDPDAHYRRGLVLEKLGRESEATGAFSKASDIDPKHYPEPTEISAEACEQIVEEALASLPSPVLEFLRNVPILVEDFASRRIVIEDNVSPQVLGLFVGSSYQEKTWITQAMMPDQIFIFRKSLEKIGASHEDLVDEIRTTLLHEVGHYLGFGEEELAEMGYE